MELKEEGGSTAYEGEGGGNPFNGIERWLYRGAPPWSAPRNPFNGIERQIQLHRLLQRPPVNPFNGIERQGLQSVVDEFGVESIQWN